MKKLITLLFITLLLSSCDVNKKHHVYVNSGLYTEYNYYFDSLEYLNNGCIKMIDSTYIVILCGNYQILN